MDTDTTASTGSPQTCEIPIPSPLSAKGHPERQEWYAMNQGRYDINTYLPMAPLRERFLYSIEVNELKYGQLASACRHWRSAITSIASLWSSLRLGTWIETEKVATWLQRAYPSRLSLTVRRVIRVHLRLHPLQHSTTLL